MQWENREGKRLTFHDDKHQLDPKTHPQHPLLPITHPQPLILGTNKNRANHVTRNKQQQKPIMHPRMSQRVENAQQDQARRARDGEDHRQPAQHLFRRRGVGRQLAGVAEPALGGKGQVQEDGGHDTAGDEEGFQALGADVGDVGYVLVGGEGGVMGGAFGEPGY